MVADFTEISKKTEISGIAQITVSAEFADIAEKKIDEFEIAVIDEFAAVAGLPLLPKLLKLPRLSKWLDSLRLLIYQNCGGCRDYRGCCDWSCCRRSCEIAKTAAFAEIAKTTEKAQIAEFAEIIEVDGFIKSIEFAVVIEVVEIDPNDHNAEIGKFA